MYLCIDILCTNGLLNVIYHFLITIPKNVLDLLHFSILLSIAEILQFGVLLRVISIKYYSIENDCSQIPSANISSIYVALRSIVNVSDVLIMNVKVIKIHFSLYFLNDKIGQGCMTITKQTKIDGHVNRLECICKIQMQPERPLRARKLSHT